MSSIVAGRPHSHLVQHGVIAIHHRIQRIASVPSTRTIGVSLFLTALVLRVIYALIVVDIDPVLNGNPLLGDAASYDRIARSLINGTGFSTDTVEPTAFWPPVYPMLLAALYWLFGHDLMIARILNALLGAFVPVVLYVLGCRLFDRRVALLAAIGSICHPILVALGVWLTADGPFVLLVCLALLLMTSIQERPTTKRLLLLGALLGFAFLLKPVIGFFLPLLVPWFIFSLPRQSLMRRVSSGLITLVGLVLMLTPWTIRNQVELGSPIVGSTNGGYTFYGANNKDAFGGHYEFFPPPIPGLSEAEQQQEYYRLGLSWIRDEPAEFLRLEMKKMQRLVSPLSIASRPDDLHVPGAPIIRVVYAAFLILAIVGELQLRHQWRTRWLLMIPIIAVVGSTLVFYGDVRYTMPMVPSLLLLASAALVAGLDAIVRRVAT
jgi:4-amino-4-deoxy-L-arabinose transferase-like glycosyltransferase